MGQGQPQVFNTDQGSQFTSGEFTQVLQDHEVKISMDREGRYADNTFMERLWRTVGRGWCGAMPGKGVHKREETLGLEVEWLVALRPGRRRQLEPGSDEALAEKLKAQVRAKVEHPFLRLKRLFGYGKVRYRGLAKNTERLALLFGLGNL